MPFDWNQLIEDPAFNLGLGLLAGAPTRTPYEAAAQQINRYQLLRQNRQQQQMQAKLYEAQAAKAQEEADARAQQSAALSKFQSQYNPDASPQDQLRLAIQTGAISPQQALITQLQQAEIKARSDADRASREAVNAATVAQRQEAAQLRDDAARRHDQILMAMKQMGLGNAMAIAQLGQTKPPPGYRASADGNLEAIPGGPADTKREAAAETATQKFANMLQQNKIPGLSASITELNNTLGQYNEKTLPGVGYAKNLPLANYLLSDSGKVVKSQSQAVANDLLNMYSGLAVTLPESERRDLEQMKSGAFSAADFYRAWPLVVKRYNNIVGNLSAGYGPDVTERYSSRPGAMSLAPIEAATGGTAATPQGRKVVRTGRRNGKRVVQYDDGTIEEQ